MEQQTGKGEIKIPVVYRGTYKVGLYSSVLSMGCSLQSLPYLVTSSGVVGFVLYSYCTGGTYCSVSEEDSTQLMTILKPDILL